MFLLNPYIYGKPYSNQYSMIFDGVDESFATAISPTFNPASGGFSGFVWVKVVDTVTGIQFIFGKDPAQGGSRDYLLWYRGTAVDRKIRIGIFHTNNTSSEVLDTVAGRFEDGNWHSVAWTFTGDTTANGIKLYIDGSFVNQITAVSTGVHYSTGTNTAITIGDNGQQLGSWAFGGGVEEPAMWNRVLTPTEISEMHNGGIETIDYTPYLPDVWWRMGDDTGDVWGGTNWTLKDVGFGGHSADMTSKNMEEVDRVTDVP